MSRIAKYQVLLRYFKVYSDIFNLLKLSLALLPKSVWNEAISVHFDPKILLNLSGKHLYDTHWVQVGLKVWCQKLKMYYAYFTRICYSDIFNLLRLFLALLPKSVWNEAISVHFDSKILLNLSEKHLHDTRVQVGLKVWCKNFMFF